jgi:hypothetical protein
VAPSGQKASQESGVEWSEREELVLGRNLNPLAVVHEQAREQAWHLCNAAVHLQGTR